MQNSTKRANDFLKIANEFKLGELTTESRHPLTMNLSTLSQTELIKAISILKNIDLGIFEVLEKKVDTILELQELFLKTIGDGNRIFFSGCGSTGRLSLTLEFLWRQSNHSHKESVIGLMAGGDSALIKAIEDFEDHPEYARHHLMDLGFKDGDLLVGSSEGGETPFVIGSVEYALKHSKIKPWFVYCNPDSELLKTTTRSKDIISNPNVKKFNLTVGPMAISGSTRMQASTIILFALGLALLSTDKSAVSKSLSNLKNKMIDLDYGFLKAFIEEEFNCYEQGVFINYHTNNLGITILTDTTERAPTFNLTPFENHLNQDDLPALSNLYIMDVHSSKEAWNYLLKRNPRCLNWKEFPITHLDYFYGFDISMKNHERRKRILKKSKCVSFNILEDGENITWSLNKQSTVTSCKGLTLLEKHLLLKMLLNIHSTLIMGKMNRYEGNLMTFVKPSCNKLIDRAIRYVTHLLKDKGVTKSYDEICFALFAELENISPSEPIVLRTLSRLLSVRN
ncbi:MAG: hypothetical protein A2381_05890 [Bdellovibrionales bacterium RIFOXYB1_FULL_37_110]|nr:MAG: hypothetical protein A2417_04775 [Bdellovibrionales bacterium RIFOXYC1_FULL_37_79]OFZ59352.1 MAG: hypothetical protein A2381_05890 [Bdellovibrionales bacterium RIFOXYB1_FULL_37_110]OFZ61912.1 MAG: hypothetical protein A2577_17775 [Bdellovibrionales bacterium RIFOXYD1_FULL_36_51]